MTAEAEALEATQEAPPAQDAAIVDESPRHPVLPREEPMTREEMLQFYSIFHDHLTKAFSYLRDAQRDDNPFRDDGQEFVSYGQAARFLLFISTEPIESRGLIDFRLFDVLNDLITDLSKREEMQEARRLIGEFQQLFSELYTSDHSPEAFEKVMNFYRGNAHSANFIATANRVLEHYRAAREMQILRASGIASAGRNDQERLLRALTGG